MRTAYLWLARLISLLIVVQAMTITFAVAGLFHWITAEGGALDDSVVKGWDQTPPTFEGALGHFVHAFINGQVIIPLAALLLVLVSFFAKVSKGVVIALVVLGLVVLQIVSGLTAQNMPYLGLFHGLNAFLIFGAAMAAAMKAKEAPAAVAV